MDNTDKDLKEDRKAALRQCLITRDLLPKEEMLRFVVAPFGRIVLDLNCKLEGRGFWVKADRESMQKALETNVFAKSMKKKYPLDFDLDFVIARLREHLLSMLSLANKAGVVVTGLDNVKEALVAREVSVVIIAKDSSQGSEKKLQSYLSEIETVRIFNDEELGGVFSRDSVMFIALKNSKISHVFRQEALKIEKLTG